MVLFKAASINLTPNDTRIDRPGMEWLKELIVGEHNAWKHEKVKRLKTVADELGVSISRLSIAWVLKNPNVSTAILGASKLDQLKEEQFPEIAIQNFNAFWDILDQAAQQDAKFRLSYAKTGCSFNDDSKCGRGNVQLVYSTNPSKKLLGFKLYIKNNSGITKQLYDTISTDFNLSAHPDLITWIKKMIWWLKPMPFRF